MTDQHIKSESIEQQSAWWGPEFAELIGVEYRTEYNKIIELACYTIINQLAYDFRDGEFSKEILKHFGVE